MIGRFLALRPVAIALLVLVSIPVPAQATPSAVHNIATCADLNTLGADSSAVADTIYLTADLDCTGVTFVPMFTGINDGFNGTFDGQGHQISNLTIDLPGSQWTGLIAQATGATIRNLTLASGSVVGQQYVGGLLGAASAVTISSVTSHLTVGDTEAQFLGGLIGFILGTSLIEDVSVTGDITVPSGFMGSSYIGGLMGGASADDASSIIIRRTSATGNVTVGPHDQRVGGLIGETYAFGDTGPASILIEDSYATGNVNVGSSGYSVGGLIGSSQLNGQAASATLTLSRTYASGTVTSNSASGGLIGLHSSVNPGAALHINDSFAAGLVIASMTHAGLVGVNSFSAPQVSTSTDNFYDGPGTGQSACAGLNALTGDCTRIDTGAQPGYFKGNHTNAPMSAWDFTTVWMTNAGDYPVLIPFDDGDGVNRAEETASPNAGDANGDGLADAAQASVAGFPDAVSGHYAALQSSCGSLFSVQIGAESTAAGQTDIAYNYPAGLMGFVVAGCTPGATATITQYYYGSFDPATLTMRKSDSGAYATVSGATLSTVTIGGQTVLKAVYQITDGSTLDQDGIVNGNIVDPAGPAGNVLGIPNTGLGGRIH